MKVKKLIEIRQQSNNFAKMLGIKDSTTHPQSFVGKYPMRDKRTGEWITGLTEEEEVTLGKRLKKDLSVNSEFWESLYILLVDRTNKVVFNLDNPLDEIKYKCALANKYFAPTKEDLKEEPYHGMDCYLYIYDPEADLKRENDLRNLRDEASSLIFAMQHQKEKMLYCLAKTGKMTNSLWSEGVFLKGLRTHLDGLVKKEGLEHFIKILKTPNLTLQVEYDCERAKGSHIKYINGMYVFGALQFGSKWDSVIEHFQKNEEDFALLQAEFAGV